MRFIISLCFLLSIHLSTFCQEEKDKVIIKNGLEYKISGRDTSIIIDKMPVFPGGQQGLTNYLQTHFKKSKIISRNETEGTVYVRFIVDANGAVTDCKIIKSVNSHVNAEIIRIVKSMPNWKPGEQHGIPIPVSTVLPLRL
jgi:protein TonB